MAPLQQSGARADLWGLTDITAMAPHADATAHALVSEAGSPDALLPEGDAWHDPAS